MLIRKSGADDGKREQRRSNCHGAALHIRETATERNRNQRAVEEQGRRRRRASARSTAPMLEPYPPAISIATAKSPGLTSEFRAEVGESFWSRGSQKKPMTRQLCSLALGFVIVSSLGCSVFKIKADVSSSTSWSGSFNGRTVDGTGSMSIDMGIRGSVKCATVQKQTREGFLTVSVDGGDEKTTTAEFGVVTSCTN